MSCYFDDNGDERMALPWSGSRMRNGCIKINVNIKHNIKIPTYVSINFNMINIVSSSGYFFI